MIEEMKAPTQQNKKEREHIEYAGYLFAHFTGESEQGEQVYFSISEDGLHWEDLNHRQPVLYSKIGEKGVRDPFILRAKEGDKFFLIATDLRIANGFGWNIAQYNGSRSLIIWESTDLIQWSEPRKIEVGIEGAGCVWAPEAIYDKETDDYLVFWASMVKEEGELEAKQRIYYAKTKDFITFSKTQTYIERENHVIDTTIIKDGEWYYRFSKDETTKNIKADRGKELLGEFYPVEIPEVEALIGVEGPAMFPFYDKPGWCLMVDQFAEGKGYLPLLCKNLEELTFRVLEESEYDMGLKKVFPEDILLKQEALPQKRHGSVIRITKEEMKALQKQWGNDKPILSGLYADPDLIKVKDIYYLYPTTDGYENWSGTEFFVFSSQDLKHWKKENKILDLATEEVPWAIGSAWAPCVGQKDGMYYFYFCGKRSDNQSCIGVAVGESPIGPFRAKEEPLITPEICKQAGIQMSQAIDPSIYEENGDIYLLFGNGAAAIVKLKEDMINIDIDTMKNIEGAEGFREAITVLKRGDIYHFTWSCDDTGSENYHVNYGIAQNLYGPIAYQYTILEKCPKKDILGTGHHCILKEPEEDAYFIAYHRFGTPLSDYPIGKGFHREVCLNRILFGIDGKMKKIEFC